jgi:hypothetical protein
MSNNYSQTHDLQLKKQLSFSVFGTIKDSWLIYKNNFLFFNTIYILLPLFYSLFLLSNNPTIHFFLLFFYILVTIIVFSAITLGVYQKENDDNSSILFCLKESLKRVLTFILILFLFYLLLIACSIPLVISSVLVAKTNISLLFPIIVFLTLMIYAWFSTSFMLTFPVCVIEEAGALASISTSHKISKGFRNKFLAILLLFFFAAIIIFFIIYFISSIFLTGFFSTLTLNLNIYKTLMSKSILISLIIQVLIGPFTSFFYVTIGQCYVNTIIARENKAVDTLSSILS